MAKVMSGAFVTRRISYTNKFYVPLNLMFFLNLLHSKVSSTKL